MTLRCRLFGHDTKTTEAETYVRTDDVMSDPLYTKGTVKITKCKRVGCTHLEWDTEVQE